MMKLKQDQFDCDDQGEAVEMQKIFWCEQSSVPELMGDRMKSIKAGTQVLGLDNCMDVLSLTENEHGKKSMFMEE